MHNYRSAYATIEVELEPGKFYIPRSEWKEGKIMMWLADAPSKEVASWYVIAVNESYRDLN